MVLVRLSVAGLRAVYGPSVARVHRYAPIEISFVSVVRKEPDLSVRQATRARSSNMTWLAVPNRGASNTRPSHGRLHPNPPARAIPGRPAFDIRQQIPHAFGRGAYEHSLRTSMGGCVAALAGRSRRADTLVSHSCGRKRPLKAIILLRTPGITTARPLSSARRPASMAGSGSASLR